MAKTLLNAVNEVLKRARIIAGDSGVLTTLTDSARQPAIDVAVQVVNEGIDELYSPDGTPMPNEQGEDTITLVAGQRDYTLASTNSDFVQIRWPFIDKTNNQWLRPHPGGYNQMLMDDPEQDDTGLPHTAAIRPTDRKLHLDRAPTSVQAGRVYTYQYDKDLALALAADEVPFTDIVFRAMVPVWTQLWRRDMQSEFDADLFQINLGRAQRTLNPELARDDYSPR